VRTPTVVLRDSISLKSFPPHLSYSKVQCSLQRATQHKCKEQFLVTKLKNGASLPKHVSLSGDIGLCQGNCGRLRDGRHTRLVGVGSVAQDHSRGGGKLVVSFGPTLRLYTGRGNSMWPSPLFTRFS
jgi:hypothetical protein